MKPYIDFNAQKRKKTTNNADKNLFKLLNNAVYGKTMENMRKRIKIRIVKNEKDIAKHISKRSYVGHKIFDKSLVEIHEKKMYVTLNKPIYVGFTVLETSKLAMYTFHYDFMKIFLMILNYCLLTLTVYAMKYVMKTLMKNFMNIGNILI